MGWSAQIRRIAAGIALTALAWGWAWAQAYYLPTSGPEGIRAPAPEQVLDEPNLEELAQLPPDSPFRLAARAVGRLGVQVLAPDGSPAEAFCTAVLLGPDVALTAHHCVSSRYGLRPMAAVLEMGEPTGSGALRGERFPVTIPPLEGSAELEYALLRVRGQPGDRYGWAKLADRPVRQGEALFVIHYPRGGHPLLTRLNCRVHRSSTTDFLHSCDTLPGSSGAPMFSFDGGTLIGLHYAGSRGANFGKLVSAVVAESALLRALGGAAIAQQAPAPIPESADMSLAGQGEREVARQAGEALEGLMREFRRRSHAPVSKVREATDSMVPEPMILSEPEERSKRMSR